MPFRITEPQPATPHGASYVHTGRGGAGNYQASSTASKAAATEGTSRLPPPPSNGKFLTGRGGSGNAHDAGERPMFFFDEDMERVSANAHPAPVFHVGRGGAGNWAASDGSSTRSRSDSDSHSETSRPQLQSTRKSKDTARTGQSAGSGADSHRHVHDGVWRRLSNTLSRAS